MTNPKRWWHETSTKPVRYLSEENISDETSNIEESRGGWGPPLVSADEVQLGDEGVDELRGVISPAVLAVHHLPAAVWLLRPQSAIHLDTDSQWGLDITSSCF